MMKKSNEKILKTVISVAIIILPLSCLFGVNPVLAANPSETNRLIGEIDSLNEKIAQIDKDYGSLINSLPEFNAQAEEANTIHIKTKKKLEAKKETLNRRLIELYKAGESSWVTVLFDSQGFFDFVDRTVWSEHIVREDTQALYQVQTAEEAAREQEQEIIENRRTVRSKCSWAITQKGELEAKLSERMGKLASTDAVLARLMQQPQTELSRQINSYLAKKRSPLTGYGIAFVQAEQRTGVSATLLVGLTWAESSCATAGTWSKTNHNAWGMKGPQPSIDGGIPAQGGYCNWPDWENAIHGAADFVYHYFGPAKTAMALPGYCETGGPGSPWEMRVETARTGI